MTIEGTQDDRDDTCEEGDELRASPLHTQGQGDGGQLLDRVEAQLDILVPQLVNEHSDRIEGVIPRVSGHPGLHSIGRII